MPIGLRVNRAGLRQGHRKSREGHSFIGVPRTPWNRAFLPVIVETCRKKVSMAATNDALTETRASHPHLASGSQTPTLTERLHGTISGSLRTRPSAGTSR